MANSSILGKPFDIAGVTIKNRYAFSPVSTGGTQWDGEGHLTPKYIRYMEERAKGGFGLLVTGAISTDSVVDPYMATGPAPLLNPEAFKTSSKDLLETVHRYGTKMFAQLTLGLGRNYPGLPSTSANIVFGTENELSPELTTTKRQITSKNQADTHLPKKCKCVSA